MKKCSLGINFDEFEEAFKSLKRNKAAGFEEAFKSLKQNKAADSDDLNPIPCFKVSIQQGKFSDSLKIARVTPIFKSGDKENVNNYCLISILPDRVVSKVLERIIYNRVYNQPRPQSNFKNFFAFLL